MSIYWVVSEFSKWAVGTQDIVQVYSVILPQTVSTFPLQLDLDRRWYFFHK